VASTEAGKIALKGGSADLMLSGWLSVARERSLGDKLVFYPSSSALGAVKVPSRSRLIFLSDSPTRVIAEAPVARPRERRTAEELTVLRAEIARKLSQA